MSALEQEIVSLVQDKYLFRSVSATVNKWDAEVLVKVYQRLLSVYDNSFDYSSSSSCVEAKLQHVQKCVRLLGIGHLAPKLEELTDSNRALRIISAIDDKISAKHTVQGAAKRTRIILKKEEIQNKPAKKLHKVPVKENLEQENVDPNIHSPKPDKSAIKSSTCLQPSGSVMTQNAWLQQQNVLSDSPVKDDSETIIPTGRQLPRTPVRPTDLAPEESDSFETSKDEECKNSEQSKNLGNTEADPKQNYIPSGKQLPRTPKADSKLDTSDQEPESGISGNLSDENPHTEKGSAPNKKDTGIKVQMKGGEKNKSVKDIKAVANRRGTYVLPEPLQGQVNSISESTVERIDSFILPPPLGYEEKDSPRDFMQEQIDRRGTFTLPPPTEFKEEKSNTVAEGVDRRGTFTVPPEGYSKDSSYTNSRDFDSDRSDTFILPPPIGYDKESCNMTESSDRRGTFSINSGKQTSCDSSVDEDDSDDDNLQCHASRRGTYVLPGPPEQGNRRGTYAVTCPSDTCDRRGTYDLGKPSCVTQDYVGAVCKEQMEKQVLVFGHPSPHMNKPFGPIPDMSEFDDLPFTDEPSSQDDISNGTFSVSADEVSSERHSGNSSSQCHDQTNTFYELPLPVSITKNHPSTPRENYIPRGKQIPRTPNDPLENESKEMSNLTSTSGSTFEQSNSEDPNFSVQIFLKEKIPVAPEDSKYLNSEKEYVVLANSQKGNACANSIQVKRTYQIPSDELNTATEVEKEGELNIDKHFDGNTTYIQEKSGNNDLQNSLLEGKSQDDLKKSWSSEQGSYLEFNDSREIFPSRMAKKGHLSNHRESYGTESNPLKENTTKRIARENTANHKKQLSSEHRNEPEHGDNSKSKVTIEKLARENEMRNKNKKNSTKETGFCSESVPNKYSEEITQGKTELEKTSEKPKDKDKERNKDRVEVRNKLEMLENSPGNLKVCSSEQASILEFDDSREIFPSRMAKKEHSSNHKESYVTKSSPLKGKTTKRIASEKQLSEQGKEPEYSDNSKAKVTIEKLARENEMRNKNKKNSAKETGYSESVPNKYSEEITQGMTELEKINKKHKEKDMARNIDRLDGRNKLETVENPVNTKEENNEGHSLLLLGTGLDDSDQIFLHPVKTKKSESKLLSKENKTQHACEPYTQEQEVPKENVQTLDITKNIRLNKLGEKTVVSRKGRRKKELPETNEDDNVKNEEPSTITKQVEGLLKHDSSPQVLPKRGRRKKNEQAVMEINKDAVISQKDSPSKELLEVAALPIRGRRKKKEPELLKGMEEDVKFQKPSSTNETYKVSTPPKRGRKKKNELEMPEESKDIEVKLYKNSSSDEASEITPPAKQGRRNRKTVPVTQKVNNQKKSAKETTEVFFSESVEVNQKNASKLLKCSPDDKGSDASAKPKQRRRNNKTEPVKAENGNSELFSSNEHIRLDTPKQEIIDKIDSEQIAVREEKSVSLLESISSKESAKSAAVSKRGKRNAKATQESLQQVVDNDKKLPSSTELERTHTPQKKGKPQKNSNGKTGDSLEETLPVQRRSRKKKESVEDSDNTMVENISNEVVEQPTSKVKPRRQTSKKETATASPSKTKTRQKRKPVDSMEQVNEMDMTNAVEKITSELEYKSKRNKGSKKINSEQTAGNVDEMDISNAVEKVTSELEYKSKKTKGSKNMNSEQVAGNIEQVDEMDRTNAVEIVTSELEYKSKRAKGSKKINSEQKADETSDTKKQRGRKKKVTPERNLEPDLDDIQETTKKREIKASQKKKVEEVKVSAPEEIPAATGRASRRCKTKASAAIAEALNSSDTEFLKNIRAYYH